MNIHGVQLCDNLCVVRMYCPCVATKWVQEGSCVTDPWETQDWDDSTIYQLGLCELQYFLHEIALFFYGENHKHHDSPVIISTGYDLTF